MKAPIVQQYMTRLPLEIERVDNVANARRLMDLFGIRHVPVMQGLHLKGVVSQRDILDATIRYGKNIDDVPIEEIYQHDVLTVSPLTPIDQVAEQMLQRGVGSAMVVDANVVVGIFTSTDALRLLTEVFGQSRRKSKSQ
ncbi:MAG: CBS domain-containing protein [Pirellulaceae bacterium]